jgi:hypothetical protein
MKTRVGFALKQFLVLVGIVSVLGLAPVGQVLAASGAYPASGVIGQTSFDTDDSGDGADELNEPWGSTAIDFVHHHTRYS